MEPVSFPLKEGSFFQRASQAICTRNNMSPCCGWKSWEVDFFLSTLMPKRNTFVDWTLSVMSLRDSLTFVSTQMVTVLESWKQNVCK